ncbi:hypothetical protein GCM10027578_32010 [Spirosoma luteolum]|jgi:hypothetical protein
MTARPTPNPALPRVDLTTLLSVSSDDFYGQLQQLQNDIGPVETLRPPQPAGYRSEKRQAQRTRQ